MKKFLKIIGFGVLGIVIIIGCIFAYVSYSNYQEEKEMLTYATEAPWVWHNKLLGIQIHFDEETKQSLLRKVNLKEKTAVYAYMGDDYELHAHVKFITDCKPDTTITTTKKFSAGEYKDLQCHDSGRHLIYAVKWGSGNTDVILKEDLGGFSVNENFTYWDFTKLKKEITLSKAKTDEKRNK